METDKLKNEYITKKDLEEQTQVILAAFDKRFLAQDKNMNQMEDRLRTDINNVQTLIDSYVKEQEGFKQEFVIMKEEVKQIKQIIKEKLGIEIQAI